MIFSGHINQPAKINSKGLSKDRNLEKRVRPQDLTEKENEEFNLEAIEAEWIE
jgi:hypothetical protein